MKATKGVEGADGDVGGDAPSYREVSQALVSHADAATGHRRGAQRAGSFRVYADPRADVHPETDDLRQVEQSVGKVEQDGGRGAVLGEVPGAGVAL